MVQVVAVMDDRSDDMPARIRTILVHEEHGVRQDGAMTIAV
jgi:hypothetical protein